MQSACGHICRCGDSSQSQAQSRSPSNHTTAAGEWVWSTNPSFALPSTSCLFSPVSTSKIGIESSQASTTVSVDLAQHGHESLINAWAPQVQSMGDLWDCANPLDADDSLFATGLDLNLQTTHGAIAGCGNAFPISPQESLSTPGLVHSPSNPFAYESACSSTGLVMTAQGPSSVSSTGSVPATPTSMHVADMGAPTHSAARGSVPQTTKQESLGDWNERLMNGRQSAQGLASAFDFSGLTSAQNVNVSTASAQIITSRASATVRGCGCVHTHCTCPSPLARSTTSRDTPPVPTRIAIPAPGWLNPDLIPNELQGRAPASANSLMQHAPSISDEWSFFASGSDAWTSAAPVATSSRYEPYRSASIASTASNSSQNFLITSPGLACHRSSMNESMGGRRRSSTVGSLPGSCSNLVDRVRLVSVTRPQSPIGQQQSLPASPGSSSRANFNSMPCRGSRPSEPSLRSVFLRDAGEGTSIKERRVGSWNSRGRLSTASKSPLAGLFDSHELRVTSQAQGMVEGSPALSETSQGTNTPTSSTFPASPTIYQGLTAESTADSDKKSQAKIAVHHHRTKLQRNVLNEVVTSLQGAYKHCRRQRSNQVNAECVEQYSLVVSQLGQLDMQEPQDPLAFETWMAENDPCSSANNSSVMIPGETKEMRKNRQKAESKMRMRRKEVVQFAALTMYAKMAYDHVEVGEVEASAEALVSKSLAQVFLEHREDWGTLIALEKRLFHTVRVKLGLQELFVKKLAERLSKMSPASTA